MHGMPKIGDVVADKYRLDRVAGEGGMGIVYAAEHLVLKQRVAVKVLLPEAALSEAMVERFAREARAAAKISSEHVARVLDAGSLAVGTPFLVMEYLDGCDLGELLELQKTLPVAEVVDYLIQALEGLAHAHAAKLVHRDLKPANLFLACQPDGSNAIKLLDFGISKAVQDRPEDKRLTGQHVLGSPVYMSPEQLRNSNNIDGRADIWSIGIVAYELLTGDPPFDGDGVGEIFAAILEKDAVPPHTINAKIPRELSDIILRCLRRNPADRWGDAGQLARALLPFGRSEHGPLVERSEQVLARAKRLTITATPIEARRVVAAIDEAEKRAMTSATRAGSGHPILLVTPPSKRRPKLLFQAAGGALALVASASLIFGVRHLVRQPVATTEAMAINAPGHEPSTPNAPSPPTVTVESAQPEPAPLVMDLPSNGPARGSSRGRSAKPAAKPLRPKFLNSRE